MFQRIARLAGSVNRRPRRPPTAALLALLTGIAACAAACGPLVGRATFPARPDTLRPGELLGPYEGVVLDAETERPLSGAVVAASWAFERGLGLVGPAGAREVVTQTGVDGRYRIPLLEDLPSGASTRVQRFTLIVYQRGYVGYRSDRRFPGGEMRRDFAQRGNRVRLERWKGGLRHHHHLVFLGGGPAVRAAAGWEVQPAALELEGGGAAAVGARVGAPDAQAPAAPKALDVTPLLSEDEVRGVTGYAGAFEVVKLTDLPSTEFYDSRHFKARGRPESFDVGLRVWRLGAPGAEEQYRKLLTELPGAMPTDEIGDASLRARSGEVAGLAFLLRERGVVVSLTCGVALCTEAGMILRLAKLVEGHVGALPATAPPAAPAGQAPP